MKVCPCDSETTLLLRRIAGAQLYWIALQPYPQNAAYRQAMIATSEASLVVRLVEETVGRGFGVEIVQVRLTDENIDLDGWDRIEFGDFRINRICMIRQKIWQEPVSSRGDTVGIPRSIHIVGGLESLANDDEAALVDAGFILSNPSGSEVALTADAFPLLLRLQMNAANPILGDRVDLIQPSEKTQ